MKPARLGLVLLLGALWSGRAFAQDPAEIERAKESFKAGAAAYSAGEYLAAIQALDAAYALTPLPAIAFSLAQAERKQYFVEHQREHLERAILLFRRYVEQVPSGGRRADALDALSQLEPLALAQSGASQAASPAPAAAPADAVRSTRLVVTSDAPRARLSLDGAPPSRSPLIREVEPGRHRVTVEAPGFVTVRRDLVAVAGELSAASIPLREKPSTLALWTAEDADIYVDGTFVSTGGQGIVLQLSSGFHDLAVAQKGHRVASRQLRLTRGGGESLRFVLEPTSLRLASQVLFISSGAALGGGLVLSALAIRAENRTEDFLARRQRENVTKAELVSYDTAVANRDRYRTAAVLSVGASVGLFVTALFLHELDEPRPQQLLRRTRPPRPAHKALSLQPLIASDHYGALLGGAF
jgi:tetratricopeptide (TPR) repeat protein